MKITGKLNSKLKSATQFFADKLISKQMQRHVSVRVSLKNYSNFFGETEIIDYNESDKPRHFVIRVRNKLSEKEKLRTIAHEMVHVKQFLYNELNEEMSLWKGKPTRLYKVPYDSQPWEKEAWSLGDKLFEEYYEYTKSI